MCASSDGLRPVNEGIGQIAFARATRKPSGRGLLAAQALPNRRTDFRPNGARLSSFAGDPDHPKQSCEHHDCCDLRAFRG